MTPNAFDAPDFVPDHRECLSPSQFSRLSGLSLATVHRYRSRGRLPFVQPGGPGSRVLIPRDALAQIASFGAYSDAVTGVLPRATAKNNTPVETTSSRPDASQDDIPRLAGPRPKWQR